MREYPGDCSRMHGHNWIIEVYVRCKELDKVGIGIDFRDIQQALKKVLSELDHFNLNELDPFKDINPTSENIARFIYREIGKILNTGTVRVSKVLVSETPNAGAYYWEE